MTGKEGEAVTIKLCHGASDQNTQVAHANGCGSPLTALLESSRCFWTLLGKGLSNQWLILLNQLTSFLLESERVCRRWVRKEEAVPAFQALWYYRGQDCDQCVWELVWPGSLSLSMTHVVTLYRDHVCIGTTITLFWKIYLVCKVKD